MRSLSERERQQRVGTLSVDAPEEQQRKPMVNRWVASYGSGTGVRLRLFCFPYAGGGASVFRAWSRVLSPEIDVCAVQLPGRETRLGESPYDRMHPLISMLVPCLSQYFGPPFAFFGHSMGALVAFELARELSRRRLATPVHLFVSACGAPHLQSSYADLYRLPNSRFVRALRLLNGTPPAVLEHPELLQLVLPVLRADFAVCGTYEYREDSALGCAITAYGGIDDPDVSRSALDLWRNHTTGRFETLMFPGDHFFLRTSQTALLAAVRRSLTILIGGRAGTTCVR
jgi:surfactin synthase thioesterase subunit